MSEKSDELETLGIIPDGNRRYADKNGISYGEAYQEGFKKVEEVYEWVIDHESLDEVFFYALSTENLKRDDKELDLLFDLFNRKVTKLADSDLIHDNEVNVDFLGKEEYLGPVKESMDRLEEVTSEYDDYSLNICMGYGGRTEIVDAAEKLAEKDMEFNEENLQSQLYNDSDVDLVLRTGGYQRLSNFLLWQNSYAELFFSDHLWPELDKKEFDRAVDFYESTKRKFGK